MSIRQERRKILRENLIDITEKKIAVDGVQSVSARYLSGEAGCALGAIYNIFEDLNELFLAVNLRCFQRMAQFVETASTSEKSFTAHERLNAMGQAYLQFALDNKQSWLALFEIELAEDQDIPVYYQDSLLGLLEIIKKPVAEIFPIEDEEQISLIANTVFSSIHGIVQLGVQRRVSVLDRAHLEKMIHFSIHQLGDAT